MQPLFAFEHPFYPEPRRADCPVTHVRLLHLVHPKLRGVRCAGKSPPHALEDVPRRVLSSNPFDFMQFRTLLRNGASPTPFPSITSALFPTQWRGECISCPSARHSSLALRHRKPCVCHTSERSPANPFICHTSKNGPPQVPCLPHLRYPPLYTSFFPSWFGVAISDVATMVAIQKTGTTSQIPGSSRNVVSP
jgi:hypothetical protein